MMDNVGPLSKFAGIGLDRAELFRWFDQTTFEFIILGDSVDIGKLEAELRSMLTALKGRTP